MFSDSFDKSAFLKDDWQQRPKVLSTLFADLIDCLSGDDLAGLACEPTVESRIISGSGVAGVWSCTQGPMSEELFAKLPDKNWTLLVQGVDQWDERVRSLLSWFDFLPRWRLEDVMASVAPVGGGVGPHFDYYDVFLIQVSGTRQWRLGQTCDEATPLQTDGGVKLLQEFHERSVYELKPGDGIYIPAGVAHWGTALSDDCITLSVGFRAPSEKEILSQALENIIQPLSEHQRYQDTAVAIDSHPSKINAAVSDSLSGLLKYLSPEQLMSAVDKAFGQLVTEPRYEPVFYEEDGDAQEEPFTLEELAALLRESPLALECPPHTRLAFSSTHLFLNGEAFAVAEAFARSVCEGEVNASLKDEDLVLLLGWLNDGDINLG